MVKISRRKIVYGALEAVVAKRIFKTLWLFEEVLENARPTVEVKARRVGECYLWRTHGVRPSRRTALLCVGQLMPLQSVLEESMALRLAGELNDASEGKGAAIKKRDDVHRMADRKQSVFTLSFLILEVH